MFRSPIAIPRPYLSTGLLAAALVLTACGGGGGSSTPVVDTGLACKSCSAGTLTGVAAAGAALASAEVVVTGANGVSTKVSTNAAGLYVADVSGLSAPYLIQVVAQIGSTTVALHSLATSADVGTRAVNITPLTEIMSASVLKGDPQTLLTNGAVNFANITAAALTSSEAALRATIAPVLSAAGLGAVDLRSTEFAANHAGLDSVLDALKVSQASNGYSITLVTGGASLSVDPANLAAAGTLTAPVSAALTTLATQTGEIQARLDELAARFASAIPAAADLAPYFTADFQHDGMTASTFIDKVLRVSRPASEGSFSLQGVSFGPARIERVLAADTLEVSFPVRYRKGFVPDAEKLLARRVNGQWQFAGNGQLARVRVSLFSRLKEKPLTLAEVQALPGVHTFDVNHDGNLTYFQLVNSAAGGTTDLFIGSPGGATFGVIAFAGDPFTPQTRLQRLQDARYLAKTSGRVSNYMLFRVPVDRVTPGVTEIVITGPGLPAGGLTLEPPIRRERAEWVFKGDLSDWNAFNVDRCAELVNASNPMPSCGLDWSLVRKGSVYTFTLKNQAGAVVGTLTDTLLRDPVDEAQAYAQRAKLFPIFNVNAATAPSLSNVFNDASGPYLPGKSVKLDWTVPNQPGYRISGITLTVQIQALSSTSPGGVAITDYASYQPLYDADPRIALPVTATFSPSHPSPAGWVWTTLSGIDAFGNSWDHELSPVNPQ